MKRNTMINLLGWMIAIGIGYWALAVRYSCTYIVELPAQKADQILDGKKVEFALPGGGGTFNLTACEDKGKELRKKLSAEVTEITANEGEIEKITVEVDKTWVGDTGRCLFLSVTEAEQDT